MVGFVAGFFFIVGLFIAADHVSGGFWAFPMALLVCVLAVVLSVLDRKRS